MKTINLKLEEPTPPIPREREVLEMVAIYLRANPKRWLLLGKTEGTPGAGRQTAYIMRTGKKASPLGRCFGPGFDVEHRIVLGEQRIYVRYIGGA